MMKKIIVFLISLSTLLTINAYSQENSLEPTTVVLVHGFMRSKMNMIAFEHSFKKEGWNVINWSYPSRKKHIQEHAKDLVVQLKHIAQQHPNIPINFVTHSMGGLVVRCALNQSDCPIEAKVGRAVLIAPPNRGSSFARNLCKYRLIRWIVGKKSGQQLMTTAFDDFDSIGNFPKEMSIMVISGTAGYNPLIPGVNDGKVSVQETCLKTPHYHVNCNAGHSWICYTPSVIKTAKSFLLNQDLACRHFSEKH